MNYGPLVLIIDGVRRHRRAPMNTLIHLKRHGEVHFHLHPLLETFSLIASFLLAVLVVSMLVSSAR